MDSFELEETGNALYKSGHFKEAIECYDDIINKYQTYSKAYYNKGNSLYQLEKYEKAVEAYDNVIKNNPDSKYFSNKGAALYKLGFISLP